MEVGQGPNLGCSAKEKKMTSVTLSNIKRQAQITLGIKSIAVVFLHEENPKKLWP
jgi:hypothetical protein